MGKQQVLLPQDVNELNLELGLGLCTYLSRATAPFPAGGLALRDLDNKLRVTRNNNL